MRAVLDANVVISALISPRGAPAAVLRAWRDGAFELVASEKLLAELHRALSDPKLSGYVSSEDAEEVIEWLRRWATIASDPPEQPSVRSPDPGDDYLLSLATAERAALVSGDGHLLSLSDELPIFSPARFLAFLEESE